MFLEQLKGGMMVRKNTYIFVDVEATLIRGQQHIIEIGAIKWLPDGTIERFSQLIQPYKFKKLNAHIQKLTGITTGQLLNAPPFKLVMPKFMKWCGKNSIFVTFGEFDRKVLEEELIRNHMDVRFLYPIIDFQQKYMIENQLKEQPSLMKLLEQYDITTDINHRALADAISLFHIFKEANGEELIEKQRTDQFGLILSEFRQQEETYDLYLSYISGRVWPTFVDVQSIKTIHKQLFFEIKEEHKELEDGDIETIHRTMIQPNQEVESFIKMMINDIQDKVLITRSGLKQLAKINRLHHAVFPKTEVVTLQHLLQNDEAVNEFTIHHSSVTTYENKLQQLMTKYEKEIIAEFEKRNLFVKEKVDI